MKSIITLAVGTVLAHIALAATTTQPPRTLSEIHLNVKKLDAVEIVQKAQPNWDRDILAPLRKKQSDDAVAAQKAECDNMGGVVENSRCIVPEPAPQPQPVVPVVVRSEAPAGSPSAWMTAAGISPSDFDAVDYIVSRESGWDPTNYYGKHQGLIYNPASSAAGLPQALPYSKTGCAWGDPVCQLQWADNYAKSKFGGWWAAKAYWMSHSNW